MGEEPVDVIGGDSVLTTARCEKSKLILISAPGRFVEALGDLIGLFRGFRAAVAVNLERNHDPTVLSASAGQLQPVFGGEGRRRVVVVQLDVDLDGAGVLLRGDPSRELLRVVRRDEANQVPKPVLLRQAPVLGVSLVVMPSKPAAATARSFCSSDHSGFAGGWPTSDQRWRCGNAG